MNCYFDTKKQTQREQGIREELERQRKKQKQNELAFLEAWKSSENEGSRKVIEKIYHNLRFYIREDGTIVNWVKHYLNRYTRLHRNEFLGANEIVFKEELNS